MPFDPELAEILRVDLAGLPALTERRMFGGLAFLSRGHMVAGLYRDGGMVRVGKAGEAAALAEPGRTPMAMGARPMPGMVEVTGAGFRDAGLRGRLLALAVAHVAGLPDKRP